MSKDAYTIRDSRYQFYQALADDEGFRKEITRYKLKLSLLNHPLPIGGFQSDQEAEKWIETVEKDHNWRIKNDKSYIEKERKITGGKDRVSLQELSDVEELRKKLLPPCPYFAPLLEIMDHYVHGRDRDFDDFTFITDYVLKEKITYNALWLATKIVQDSMGNNELWIRIYPNTRKEHLMSYWPKIKNAQKQLTGYKDRNKGLKSDDERGDTSSDASNRTARSRRNKVIKNVTHKETP